MNLDLERHSRQIVDMRIDGIKHGLAKMRAFGPDIVMPIIEHAVTWRWAFAVLAPGPILGTIAMLRLRKLPEARKLAQGRG